MMSTDIIAESETERTVNTLLRGEADTKTQQTALASVLLALTKVVEQMNEIKGSLWKPSDLRELVDQRHKELCSECPARKQADLAALDSKKSIVTQLLSPVSMIFIMAVLSLLVAAYTMIGKQGVKDVTEVINPILHTK